ncbi:MAG: glycosyltransferase family 2 protein [Christensenellales bacterium]|jgi:cellulose synthase/poly-beta-1,6-N-acetylglucosamine synthase-like glycosyltransferase
MNAIVVVLSALGALYGLWFLLIALYGSHAKYEKLVRAHSFLRFAVIVPARNEAGVVGHLARSLLNQSYPREKYDVFVVPNGCTDDTAGAARAGGAIVLDCEVETHSKGDVLRFAFAKIPELGEYDAYCILDADNLAAPGFLRAANDAMRAGWQIAQGYRDSKNPADNWVAGATSVFFWLMNRYYNRARASLGMSAALNGTGIVLRASLVERLGWDVRTLTEDLEFSGICAAHGVKIGYIEDAVIYDEQPRSLRDSMVQRRRWFSGGMQCFRLLGGRLLRARSLHALDMLLIFCGWIIQALGLVPGILGAYAMYQKLSTGALSIRSAAATGAAMLIIAYAACALLAFWVIKREGKNARRMASTIWMFPIFLLTWIPANLWAMVTRPPKWTQIAHVRSVDAPDIH